MGCATNKTYTFQVWFHDDEKQTSVQNLLFSGVYATTSYDKGGHATFWYKKTIYHCVI